MAAVNEAWRVLSDPGRRASYDASLRASVAPATWVSAAPEVAEVDVAGEAEARSFWAVALPWILLLVVLGAIFLFTAYARGGGGDGPSSVPRAEVDGVIEPGSCIVLDGQARAVETPCAGAAPRRRGLDRRRPRAVPAAERGLLQPGRQRAGLHHAGLTSSRTP